jgi:hypothetical protein
LDGIYIDELPEHNLSNELELLASSTYVVKDITDSGTEFEWNVEAPADDETGDFFSDGQDFMEQIDEARDRLDPDDDEYALFNLEEKIALYQRKHPCFFESEENEEI